MKSKCPKDYKEMRFAIRREGDLRSRYISGEKMWRLADRSSVNFIFNLRTGKEIERRFGYKSKGDGYHNHLGHIRRIS